MVGTVCFLVPIGPMWPGPRLYVVEVVSLRRCWPLVGVSHPFICMLGCRSAAIGLYGGCFSHVSCQGV